MTTDDLPKSSLRVGDRVKLVSGTLAWRAEMTLHGKIGKVTECRDNGRVSVLFDTGRLLLGRDAGQFERVVGLDAKAK